MNEFQAEDRGQIATAHVRRKRVVGTALTEVALTVSLIVSIAVILVVAGASGAIAATRSDLIMMEETSANSALTTMAIVAVIVVVMGVLTVLALRDVAPVHSRRNRSRDKSTTAYRR
jgi:amino acid transporter